MHRHDGHTHKQKNDLARASKTVMRDRDGHRVHSPGTVGLLNRRRFMTALFAGAGVAAFATLAGCSSDDSTGSTTTSSETTGGPPSGGGGGMGAEEITEEFLGLTTDGTVVPDLYAIQASGVSTTGVVTAAAAWLASLTDDQRTAASFEVDPSDYTQDEWRLWSNVDSYERNGVSLEEMTDEHKAAAKAILEAGLSAQGLGNAETIMKLNTYGGLLVG